MKILAAAALAALAASACGRRGALEPPQAAAPPAPGSRQAAASLPDGVGLGGGRAEPDPSAVRAGDELGPTAIPPSGTEAPLQTGRGAKRGYRIPKDPFLLDPLL